MQNRTFGPHLCFHGAQVLVTITLGGLFALFAYFLVKGFRQTAKLSYAQSRFENIFLRMQVLPPPQGAWNALASFHVKLRLPTSKSVKTLNPDLREGWQSDGMLHVYAIDACCHSLFVMDSNSALCHSLFVMGSNSALCHSLFVMGSNSALRHSLFVMGSNSALCHREADACQHVPLLLADAAGVARLWRHYRHAGGLAGCSPRATPIVRCLSVHHAGSVCPPCRVCLSTMSGLSVACAQHPRPLPLRMAMHPVYLVSCLQFFLAALYTFQVIMGLW
jgi:hypothetical protein